MWRSGSLSRERLRWWARYRRDLKLAPLISTPRYEYFANWYQTNRKDQALIKLKLSIKMSKRFFSGTVCRPPGRVDQKRARGKKEDKVRKANLLFVWYWTSFYLVIANIFVLERNWSKRNKQRNLWCRFDGIFFEIGETTIKWRNKKNKQDQYQQKICDERCQRRHSFDNGKKRKSRRWLAIKRIILPFSKRSKRRWENIWWDIVEIYLKFIFQVHFLGIWI